MWSPFTTLGVDASATAEAIGCALRTASLRSHPDKGGAKEQMHLLIAARDALLDDAAKRNIFWILTAGRPLRKR